MRILIDMDDVCCHFYDRWVELYNRDYSSSLSLEDIHGYGIEYFPKAGLKMRDYFNIPGFWLDLKPVKGVAEVTKRLSRRGHDLVIVTAAPGKCRTVVGEKMDWVDEHLPHIGHRQVIAGHRKDLIDGDILLDDAKHNLESFPKISCAMDRPWNRSVLVDYRVNNWFEFEDLIERLN